MAVDGPALFDQLLTGADLAGEAEVARCDLEHVLDAQQRRMQVGIDLETGGDAIKVRFGNAADELDRNGDFHRVAGEGGGIVRAVDQERHIGPSRRYLGRRALGNVVYLEATRAGGVLAQHHPMWMPDVTVYPAIGGIVEIGVEGYGEGDDALIVLEADIAAIEARGPNIGVNAGAFELARGVGLVDAGLAADAGGEDGVVAMSDDGGFDDVEGGHDGFVRIGMDAGVMGKARRSRKGCQQRRCQQGQTGHLWWSFSDAWRVDGMILGEFGPSGSPGRRIGGFVFAAIDPQVLLAEGSIHESAMMRLSCILMRIRPEEPATDAHALNGNDAGFLKVPDHGDEGDQEVFLLARVKRAGCGFCNAAGGMGGGERSLAMLGKDDARGAAISGGRSLVQVTLAFECGDGVGGRWLRHPELKRDIANA